MYSVAVTVLHQHLLSPYYQYKIIIHYWILCYHLYFLWVGEFARAFTVFLANLVDQNTIEPRFPLYVFLTCPVLQYELFIVYHIELSD